MQRNACVHKPPEGVVSRADILIRGRTVIGRRESDPAAAYVNIFSSLSPKSISRRHAVLQSDDKGRCTISPLSLNTFINGEQVASRGLTFRPRCNGRVSAD
jgi:hypothetical protein